MKNNCIRKAKMLPISGAIGIVTFTVLFVLALMQEDINDRFNVLLPMCLTFGLVLICSLLVLVMSLLWRIRIDGNIVTYRNYFGITKTYDNRDLTVRIRNYKGTGRIKYHIYKGEKQITVVTPYDENLGLIQRFKNKIYE